MEFEEDNSTKFPPCSEQTGMRWSYSLHWMKSLSEASNFIIFVKDKEKYEIENEYASNNWKISGADQPARKL